MENIEKTKISAFEFAIMQIADPEEVKKYRPLTEKEQNQIRVDKITDFVKKIKTK